MQMTTTIPFIKRKHAYSINAFKNNFQQTKANNSSD